MSCDFWVQMSDPNNVVGASATPGHQIPKLLTSQATELISENIYKM